MLKRPFFQKPSSDHDQEPSSLEGLRETVLRRILVGAIPLGLIAYFTALPERIQQRNWIVVVVFSLAMVSLLVVALVRRIPYAIRSFVFLASVASVGIATLFADGLYGSGRVYLLAVPISAGLLLGFQAGLVGLIFSLVVFAGGGWLIFAGRLTLPVVQAGTVNINGGSWLVAIASFALVTIVLTYALLVIVRGLERTVKQSQQLGNTLDAERAQLEHRVLERTQDLERRLVQLRTAAEIIRSLGPFLDPAILLQRVVDLVKDRFKLYYVGAFLVDEAGEYAVLQAGTGEAGMNMVTAGHRLAVDDTSMIGWSVSHRQARIALDVGYDAVRFNNPNLPLTRSELALPMLGAKQVIGALTVQSSQPRAFDQDDIAVLQVIADSLATAFENARLFQQVQQSFEEIRKFNQQYLHDAWQEVTRELESSQGQSFPSGEMVSEDNVQFPLLLREQEIGKLFLALGQDELRREDRAFVEAITNQAALALENVRLLEKIQRQGSYDRLLAEVSRKVRSSTDIDTILRLTVKELGQILGASEGVIQLDITSLEQEESLNDSNGFMQSEELNG